MINLNTISDNLVGTSWVGEVVDIEDPLFLGRVRVRVFGKFDTRENPYDTRSKYVIPDDAIPWAYPAGYFSGGSATGSGSFSVPKKGSIVSIAFENGNVYYPEYSFSVHISEDLVNEIKGSYANAHSLIYDTVTEGGVKVFFTEQKGLMLDYKSNTINIKQDESIEVKNAGGDTIILTKDGNLTMKVRNDVKVECKNAKVTAKDKVHLDSPNVELGKTAAESVIKGNTFQTLFNNHTHIGNLGAPTGPPINPLTGIELSKVSKTE
jgi:hypothetical protein